MIVSRLVCFVAAAIISAIQWAAFFYPALYAQSVQAVGAPAAGESSDGSLPVVVVVARR